MKTSFAPKDFGTGRWGGGPGTITGPHFEYRDVDFGRGPEKMVTCSLQYLDRDGTEHLARFDVGNVQTRAGDQLLVIRESADEGADEAEIGPSFSHIDPDKEYKVSPKSEFGMLIAALVASGFSEAKLQNGDISVIDGLEVVATPKARKEDDRFPLLLPSELIGGKKVTGKPTARPAGKPLQAKPKPQPQPQAEEEPEAEELDATTEAARDFMLGLVAENGEGPIPIGKAVTAAIAHFKGDKKLSAKVVPMIQKAEFHDQFSDYWNFDKKTKKISAIG